jgi:hypothetical protein
MKIKNLLLELWYDLLEKRLWPVAAVLLVGLVAVPVVLSKPAEQPPAAPSSSADSTPAPNERGSLAAMVKLAETDAGSGSPLDVFDPGDPFRPPSAVIRGADGGTDEAASEAGPSDTSSDTSTSGGGDGSTDVTGGGGGGGEPGGTTDPGDTGGSDGGKTTTEYRYVIDATFTANGRKRKIKGMERLDILPSEASPLLVFLGVSSDAGNAVFLVDSTLEAAGEGKCKPSATECAFVYLGPGSEHEFTTEEGDSYTLRIDQIRKVKVDNSAGSSREQSTGKTAKAAVGVPSVSRRFVLPLLADLVSVSSGADDDSDSDDSSR